MKNKISELMDGELDAVDTDEVISALKKRNDWLSEWEAYHVISDALRQPAASLSIDVTKRVSDRLVSEPILLAPRSLLQLRKRKLISLSAAASFAILVSGWLMMQTTNTQQETLVAENVNKQSVIQVDHPIAFQSSSAFTLPLIPQHLGDYSLIHREFSPHTMMYAPVMSVYQVEDKQDKAR
jgi:negative regulator of sigma E activity